MVKKQKNNAKNIVLLVLAVMFVFVEAININSAYCDFSTELNCKSSVLIERKSGKVLNENNSHDKLPIASVTKLMTILLTLEEIDAGNISLEDNIIVSANASGMGGSQVFLDANAEYNIGELLKSVIVASANDSSVALAEHIAGSENNFVRMMNARASELNMHDTNYANCTGLPTSEGYSSSYDQAIVLNKVLDYDVYHKYSSIWLEDFVHPSGRTTQMTNTNKLSRFYDGCIGGKTGSTNQAKYCLAVGAKRGDMELISVVLGADTTKERFALASELLNYGFANYQSQTLLDAKTTENITIAVKGLNRVTHVKPEREYAMVTDKNKEINLTLNYNLPDMLKSVKIGQVVGNVEVVVDGVVVDTIDLISTETHEAASIWDYVQEIVNS